MGPSDMAMLEIQYESLAAYEASLAEWSKRPEAGTVSERLDVLVEPGGTNEVWDLVE
jgi:hypothetical protein